MDEAVKTAILSAVSQGELARAVRAAHGVLEAERRYDGYFILAAALLDGGEAGLAAQYFAVLGAALPDNAQVAFGHGLALQASGRLAEAVERWRHALDLAPGLVQACRNIAMGLIDLGRDDEAEPFLHRWRGLAPDDDAAALHLGNAAFRGGRMEDAARWYRQALQKQAGNADAWTNLGEAERSLGRVADAEDCLMKALALSPQSRQAHFNLASLLLEQGRWREGFGHFQWRANLGAIPPALAGLPVWQPGLPAGRRVALWNDQGLGDAMMFLRYAARLKQTGARVCAVLPPGLARLAATAPGIDEVHPLGAPLASFDVQISLASLPHALGQPDPTIDEPYLFMSSPVTPGEIRRRLAVGLVWAAGADSPNGRQRSLSLADLAPLAGLSGVEWTCLQVGEAVDSIAGSAWDGLLGAPVRTFHDFADTAEAIRPLDLVISVDTSVVHLAGGMGKPVWVLLPFPCDWKWGRAGERSVWYPSAVLFRQGPGEDWGPVVHRVAERLAGLPAHRR